MKTKMNIKKIAFGFAAVIAGGLIASTALVSAFQGDPTKQGPDFDADMHDLKVDAFESADYETWKDLMEQAGNSGRVLEMVNEDNFNTFVEAHNAALEGDMELSNQLRSELGLNNGVGPADGTGHKGQGRNSEGMQNKAMHKNTMLNQEFVDLNGDGLCDNDGSSLQQKASKGMGRNR